MRVTWTQTCKATMDALASCAAPHSRRDQWQWAMMFIHPTAQMIPVSKDRRRTSDRDLSSQDDLQQHPSGR